MIVIFGMVLVMKHKIYIIISVLILVVAIIGTTFALVYFRSENTSFNLAVEPELGNYINYKSGDHILGDDGKILEIGSSYTSGLSTEIEFWKTANAHNMDIYGHIHLNIDKGSKELLNMPALKWSVISNDILISEGNFAGYSEGESIPLLINQKLLSTLTKFKIYIWIDENDNLNETVSGQEFEVTISCEATSSEYYAMGSYIFDFTGKIEKINLSPGIYKLEVWGAQGGYGLNETYRGGYGGYSSGYINLDAPTDLFVAVGGQGGNGLENVDTLNAGGFNGGGNTYGTTNKYVGSGGGATHIALSTGELSTLSENINDILIVAGGGGAGGYESDSYYSTGGDAGGFIGNSGTTSEYIENIGNGGTQTSGGVGAAGDGYFGQGSNSEGKSLGGGGGFYGGGAGLWTSGSGGGSGYIGNQLLTEKVMYCFECTESDEEGTKTISTTNVSEKPQSSYAKIGSGSAKITNLQSNYEVLPRKKIKYGTNYNFKNMASSEFDEMSTIISSTFNNANELSVGEYQIIYIVVDSKNNRNKYYQKIDIIE